MKDEHQVEELIQKLSLKYKSIYLFKITLGWMVLAKQRILPGTVIESKWDSTSITDRDIKWDYEDIFKNLVNRNQVGDRLARRWMKKTLRRLHHG